MLPILIRGVLFFGFLFTFNVLALEESALECGPMKVRSRNLGKMEHKDVNACTNSTRTLFISANCKDKNCKALNFKPSSVSSKTLDGEYGKPGFKLCRALKGKPAIIEFFHKNKWYKLDECLFHQDSSFADTGSLLEKYYPR